MNISEMINMTHHLCVCVGHCVGHVDFVAGKGELVIEAELVVGARLLRIQIVDFFGSQRIFVRHIEAAVLVPAAFPLV